MGNKKDSKQAICMLIIGNWRGWRVTGLRGRKEGGVITNCKIIIEMGGKGAGAGGGGGGVLLVKHKGNKHGPLKWKGNKKDSKQAICMLIIENWRGGRCWG